jgi:bile acid:Na+ symporter, BASS family
LFRTFIEENVFLIICLTALIALLFPLAFVWLKPYIPIMLAVIMLGMGFEIKPVELKRIYEHKVFVILTAMVSFGTMTLLGFTMGHLYRLNLLEITGLVLVGACPGGFAANVMSYLSRSNVNLTIALTFLSTLISPVVTPLLIYLFLHQEVEMPVLSMAQNLLIIIALPLLLGAILNKLFKPSVKRAITDYFPLISIGSITLIIACIVAIDKQRILDFPVALMAAVLTMNIAGYLIGYIFAKIARRREDECQSISFEFGIQDSAVGIMLASLFFGAAATLPSVFYSFIQNMTAPVLVKIFTNKLRS